MIDTDGNMIEKKLTGGSRCDEISIKGTSLLNGHDVQ